MDQFQAMDMNPQKLPPTNYSPWDVSFDALWPIMPSSSPSSAQQNQTAVQQDQDQEEEEEEEEQLGAMKEMMFKMASMQPVDIDPASVRKPKRRNVRISDDPQSVAARHRRERISEKIRILQRLVPGGTKMDTASMLDEAVRYLKFLKRQIRHLQAINPATASQIPFPPSVNAAATTSPAFKCNEHQSDQN